MNSTFDKLHDQEKLHWITQFTSLEYSIFVVCRTVSEERKNRVIVDIRDFNKITILNSYSMLLQSNITAAVMRCDYICVIDAQRYFYQWSVKRSNRNKLTVVSHREQKQFFVVVMSFKNLSSYVQRQTDQILCSHKNYAKAYMNHIVVYFKSLLNHITHLHALFSMFSRLRICLSSVKSFLDYSFVSLLEQRVDDFDLTTSIEKLQAIFSFRFSRSLKELESYLELTGWLRNYISYYAQIVKSLQKRKIALNKQTSKLEKFRKTRIASIILHELIEQELLLFKHLQTQFRKSSILYHFDSEKSLFVNLNAFKVYEFNAIVYHLESNKTSSIMFLSRELNSAKKNY